MPRRYAWKTIFISLLVSSVAAGQIALPFMNFGSPDSQPAEMSSTYKSYQKTLLGHLKELRQDYLSDEYRKDIPDAVIDSENKNGKLILDKINQYQQALTDAADNAAILEKKVKEFEGEEKSLADIMTKGGSHSGYFTSVKEMAETCKKYDLQLNQGQDPEGIIKKNYDQALTTLTNASNRLWKASNDMWSANQALKKARENSKDVLSNKVVTQDVRDVKQEHVFQAQRGAYDAAKDLGHLRDAAISDYESFINKAKAKQDEVNKQNASLQNRCRDVQAKFKKVADILSGKTPETAAPAAVAPAQPAAPVKKVVKKLRPKPKAPAPSNGDGVPYIYPDEPAVPDDSENFLLTPPSNDFFTPPPSSEGDH